MVELRKRKEPTAPAPPPLAKRNSGSGSKIKKLADKAKAAVTGGPTSTSTSSKPVESSPLATSTETAAAPASVPATNGSSATSKKNEKLSEGGMIGDLASFGGQVQTHEGASVTVKELLEKSTAGVVIFTYPRASTPGCTTQACAFRDNYTPLTAAGLAVYGLSTDSPKSNTTFVTKQKLPYTLLCDPKATLIRAIGMYKGGAGSGTSRGVVVLDKSGVCRVLFQGGPQKTLDAVLEYVNNGGAATEATGGGSANAAPGEAAKATDLAHTGDTKMLEAPLIKEASRSEEMIAETAAEVGESAKLVDA